MKSYEDRDREYNALVDERDALAALLREAVKIVHCHARNTDKGWLIRARAALRSQTEVPHG